MLKVIKEVKNGAGEKEEAPVFLDELEPMELEVEFIRIISKMSEVAAKSCYMVLIDSTEKEIAKRQMDTITRAIEIINEIFNVYVPELQESVNKSKEKDTRVKKRKNAKQIIKEELKQAEFVEYDVIPVLRFTEIQANLDTVIEGYLEVGENLTYEKTREIATDLTRIENAIDNIATTINNELTGQLIYNNKELEERKKKLLKGENRNKMSKCK